MHRVCLIRSSSWTRAKHGFAPCPPHKTSISGPVRAPSPRLLSSMTNPANATKTLQGIPKKRCGQCATEPRQEVCHRLQGGGVGQPDRAIVAQMPELRLQPGDDGVELVPWQVGHEYVLD